ncbi:YggS family pyridoxal phosphate-dependent enzyme [Salisediminibacterium beveridgei]|uniref:Pyridoxal phosphate homeostasis protein n=1 Tax=Salisediminibacterium beveridgei TaxID=632773 RepID=A0A1D7QW87_9BACI|nr:YggS family pyridoxal phosphate-dependent enzyme [Salisediminibacterium beveridgei]AOM83266.1 hypothetical protein BBEV_1905 [Salisediminibacterium beveridgei]
MSVSDNLQDIHHRIENACARSGRQFDQIRIIAVTKYVSSDRAQEAIDSGIQHIGENRVEDYKEKYGLIGDQVKWHFIGTLQSKKVKKMIDDFDYIHSLDRLSLAEEIDKRANNKEITCFVQVNVSGEPSKAGLAPDDVIPFIRNLEKFESISVIGLMTMAPMVDDEEALRHVFRELRELRDSIRQLNLAHAPCEELSMGMSNDYEIAVEEGATFIRVGSSLVGS